MRSAKVQGQPEFFKLLGRTLPQKSDDSKFETPTRDQDCIRFIRELNLQKYAAELRVGDVWTERPQGRAARTYRVIAIARGLAQTTIRVTGACVTTGQRRTLNFFLVNRVEVRDEPT